MPTLREIVSTLATDARALNLDDRISYRYLVSKFQSKISYFLRLEARSREIFKDLSLWKPIRCVYLEDVVEGCCGYIDECKTLKRSKIKIPEAFNTNYGLLIKVFTLDNNIQFKFIKSIDYKDDIKREYGSSDNYVFWLEDEYIFIPDYPFEAVKVYILPKNPSEVDKINGDLNKCSSPLDGKVSYPEYLIKLAIDEVRNELVSQYKAITEDENGDDNTNKKS